MGRRGAHHRQGCGVDVMPVERLKDLDALFAAHKATSRVLMRVTVRCDCGIALSRDVEERALAQAVRLGVNEIKAASKARVCQCTTPCEAPLITVTYL